MALWARWYALKKDEEVLDEEVVEMVWNDLKEDERKGEERELEDEDIKGIPQWPEPGGVSKRPRC